MAAFPGALMVRWNEHDTGRVKRKRQQVKTPKGGWNAEGHDAMFGEDDEVVWPDADTQPH